MPCATGKTWLRHAGRLPWWRRKSGNGASPPVALFAKPVDPLKEGEVLTVNPETGERGVWRNIGGRSVFIAVRAGESVPEAVQRTQAGAGVGAVGGRTRIRRSLPSTSPDPASVLGRNPASPVTRVAVGFRDEAEQFASGSARPGRWFHGAEARFGDPAEALRASTPGQTRGAVFGSGVYLTDDAKEATQYGDLVFETRVNVKNPLVYPTEASSFQRLMDQTEPARRSIVAKQVRAFRDAVKKAEKKAGKFDEDVITAVAKRQGYDAIEVWHSKRTWLVVPDPSQIMVIEGSSKKSLALVVTPHGYSLLLSRQPTPFERKVDFAAIDSALKDLTTQGRDRVRKLLEDARDKLLSLVAGRHKAGRLTTKFVLELELRGLGQLVPTLRETLGAAFRLGQREARKELRAGRETRASLAAQVRAVAQAKPEWGRDRLRAAFSNGNAKGYQVKLVPEGLPPEKALEFFERKATLWATDVRQPLLGQVKNVLFNGIKTGAGLRDLMAEIEAAFQPWLGDEDRQVEGEDVTPYRLETLVRTNVGEAMNEGRKAQFQGAVDDGFVIGFQFSAILDTRTTPVCEFLGGGPNGPGFIFRPDSPELDQLSPPRHFNCRSLWSPVLRTEGPVEYITPQEAARGIELSGKGFEERQAARVVPVPGSNGKDREPEPVGKMRLAVPDIAVHQAPIAVRVEGPQVHVPAPVVAIEGTRVEVLQQAAPNVRLDFDVDRWADRLEAALAKRPILVNVAPNIVVNVPAQEAPRVEVTVAPAPVSVTMLEPRDPSEVVLKPELTVAVPEPGLRRVVKTVRIERDPATREMVGADVVEEEYAK